MILRTLSMLLAWGPVAALDDDALISDALRNGERAQGALVHCRRFVTGWLHHADPESGLIPRNLTKDLYWNAKDAAADNYPFMVLTAAITDQYLYHHRLREMLATEISKTSRVGPLPDDFLFATQDFRTPEPDMRTIIFGASEYVKDGLLPITEWLGPSPWSDRMLALLDGVLDEAAIDTPVGKLPATDHEVGGELMQSLSRMYWRTKNERYKAAAFQLADYFFLHRSPLKEDQLRLDDHGCEVIGGLSEVYYLAHHADSVRKQTYREPMYAILDRVLAVGRHESGLLYDAVNPKTGKVLRDAFTDNWGYNYNAFLTVDQLDNVPRFRQAVEHVMSNIHRFADYQWERGGADGYADSIEGALNLLNRIPVASAEEWVHHSIDVMLNKQRPDGIVEGWHGDGNYARTAIMYALFQTKGTTIRPWRPDVAYGAVQSSDDHLTIAIISDWPWAGTLYFDVPRHAEYLHLPSDYPRLNQFPEWFTLSPKATYEVTVGGEPARRMIASVVREGLRIETVAKKPTVVHLKKVE